MEMNSPLKNFLCSIIHSGILIFALLVLKQIDDISQPAIIPFLVREKLSVLTRAKHTKKIPLNIFFNMQHCFGGTF